VKQELPIAVSSSLKPEPLVVDREVLPFFQLVLILFYNFPPLVLPLQDLYALSLELRLSPRFLVLPSVLLVGGKVLLEPLEG